jgi:hypothetical protein
MYQSDAADVSPPLVKHGGNLPKSPEDAKLIVPTTSAEASMTSFEDNRRAIWLA